MIKIRNNSLEDFYRHLEGKKLFLFGAGRRTKLLCQETDLKGKITAIIDNNEQLWNHTFCMEEEKIPIISRQSFIAYVKDQNLSNIILMIMPAFSSWEIIKQLDQESVLNDLNCYVMDLLMEYYERKPFSFTKGIEKIPRKIHYCWFGKKQIPNHLRNYMETWKEKCPDYEIVRWDESNYDISKNKYMREAYECQKWGFVPDYARLDIIFREGGIYLDTDIELKKPLDVLLCDEMFCSAANSFAINFGQGFGAVRGHPLVKQLRDFYDNRSFYYEDGNMNLTPCFSYQNIVLRRFGFQVKNQYQKIGDVVIYPSEVAAPAGIKGLQNNFTENTIMDHHTDLSWISKEERKNMELYKRNILKRKIIRGGF